MSKGQKWYCGILIAVGVALGLWCTVAYLRSGSLLTASADGIGAGHFFFLLLLFIFSRAMPIYLSEDRCLDISFIGILSALIILGPQATVAVILLGTPFVVECGPKKGDPARHIFNSDPVKTLFNLSNLILSVYIPG